MATGVASERAQGHVTISTAAAIIRACPGSVGHQYTADSKAKPRTTTRNGAATLSASCAKRGFCVEALSINSTIWANLVCAPTQSTRNSTGAVRL